MCGAVRIEPNFGGHIDASDQAFEPNRLGLNSAAFEAGLRYSHHPARPWLVVVVMSGLLGVFVVRRLTLAAG